MSGSSSTAFLGLGVAFPLATDPNGALQQASYDDCVQQSIWMILGTAKGERVMRPDFGCGIHDLVFDMVTSTTSGRIAAAVRDALLRFEPRIDVREVRVGPGEDANVLLIYIHYEIRATINAFNLVYPFYLEGGVGP